MARYNVRAPSLPLQPTEYSKSQQDQFQNALRLYFNRLDDYLISLSGNQGASSLSFPFIEATDSTTQYATADNTATIVKWNATSLGSGFTLNVGNTATAQFAGVYKITFSLQFANNDNAAHDAIVWLRVNGSTSAADVTNSTTIFTVSARKSALIPTKVCGYSEVVFALNAGDTVGLWWGATQAATSGGATGIYMYSRAAQTTPMAYPATPSALGSITFVSAL
jgi:hypothetical protein